MATRRAFLGRLAPLAALPLVPIVAAALPSADCGEVIPGQVGELLTGAEFYHPYGYVKGGDGICAHLKAVTLDGVDIPTRDVLEADDRAGWVLCWIQDGRGEVHGSTVRRTGDVRFAWSEEALFDYPVVQAPAPSGFSAKELSKDFLRELDRVKVRRP